MFSIVYQQNLEKFGGRDFVPAIEIAQIFKPGITPNAVTIQISRGTFPLPTKKVLGVQAVSLVDYTLFCVNPSTKFTGEACVSPESDTPPIPTPKRRPGRPRNVLRNEGAAK